MKTRKIKPIKTKLPEPDTEECPTCRGYGHFDAAGEPTIDRAGRKCLDCNGTGQVIPTTAGSTPLEIGRAVNSHAALVAACRAALRYIATEPANDYPAASAIVDQLRDALAAAEA